MSIIFGAHNGALLPLHRASMLNYYSWPLCFCFLVFYGHTREMGEREKKKMGAKCKRGNIWIDKWLLELCWSILKHASNNHLKQLLDDITLMTANFISSNFRCLFILIAFFSRSCFKIISQIQFISNHDEMSPVSTWRFLYQCFHLKYLKNNNYFLLLQNKTL